METVHSVETVRSMEIITLVETVLFRKIIPSMKKVLWVEGDSSTEPYLRIK